jgi:restriction system protein
MYDVAGAVRNFVADADRLGAAEAESRLLPILKHLLEHDGFELANSVRPESQATDFVANSQGGRLGVEYKHYTGRRRADIQAVEQVLTLAQRANLSRVLLVSKSGFTDAAMRIAERDHPIELELTDLSGLSEWAQRIQGWRDGSRSNVVAVILEASKEFARAVARNPRELDSLEWRDIERMLSVVLERLGFEAELTPPAKDGGRDIVLRLKDEDGVVRSYAIEVKHWRSGKSVGNAKVKDFVQVIAREGHVRGLFLATYGFSQDIVSALTEVERERVRLGAEDKVVALCQTYVKAENGLWSTPSPTDLPELLFA